MVNKTGKMYPFQKKGNVAIHQLKNIWKWVVFLKRRMSEESMLLSEEKHFIVTEESSPQNISSQTFIIWTITCGPAL